MSATVNTRLKIKHDTTENWNKAINFIPLSGEIIIYTDYKIKIQEINSEVYIPGLKVGNGYSYIQDLPFINESNEVIQFVSTIQGLTGQTNCLYIDTTNQIAFIWNGDSFQELESSSINELKNRVTQTENDITNLQQEIIHSADKNYVHKQSSATNQWIITHNLGKYPSITVVDSAGTVVIGEIILQTTEQAVISFNGAFSGKAYCN